MDSGEGENKHDRKPEEKMREEIISKLVAGFAAHPEALGCFEGGSAAFGRNDQWSDIDFQVVVEDAFVEQAVQLLEETIRSIAPVKQCFILPQPAWHGHWQGFYQLEGISPFLILDVLIMKQSSESYFTEVELHGIARVFFDKTGRLGKEHYDRNEVLQTIPKRLKRIRDMMFIHPLFTEKEILRGHEHEAFEMYYMSLRFLVELLRIKHDPARWHFGIRYLNRILPAKTLHELDGLSFVRDFADLQIKKDKVKSMLEALLDEDLESGLEERLPAIPT
jgi:hypothetical protein